MEKKHEFEWDQKKLTYNLTYKDIVDILNSIDMSTCRELHLEVGDLKLRIIKSGSRGHASTAGGLRTAGEHHSAPASKRAQASGIEMDSVDG